MSVELIRFSGDDLDVVNAFRVSLNVEHDDFTEADAGLITRGMRDGHSSPWAQVWAKFRISCSIGCARQIARHGHYLELNEHSTRYSKMPEAFVVPPLKQQIGKSMDYAFVPLPTEIRQAALAIINESYASAYRDYNDLLNMGVSREDARSVLPLGTMTHLIVSSHMKGWLRFMAQRLDPHAQDEIREIANVIEEQFIAQTPVSMQAWTDFGRRAL